MHDSYNPFLQNSERFEMAIIGAAQYEVTVTNMGVNERIIEGEKARFWQ